MSVSMLPSPPYPQAPQVVGILGGMWPAAGADFVRLFVQACTDRMAALGHGRMEKFSAQDAITVAAGWDPLPRQDDAFQDDHGIALGSQVTIAAESFGTEPTEGELIAATRTRYTVRRTDPRAGTVHVHFPRIGYTLRKVEN